MAAQPTTVNPLGFFVRAPSALADPSPLLADNIDPRTRDFASLTKGADPVDAQVQLAMTTIRRSGAAVLEDGIAITTRKMTQSAENELESSTRIALRRLVRNGDVRLTAVSYDFNQPENQFIQQRAEYKNLRAVDSTTRVAVTPVPGLLEVV